MDETGYIGKLVLELASGVPAAVLLAVLAFLSRSLVANLFKKDLQNHKAELDRDIQSHILRLRHEHESAMVQVQVKLARLHERRFDCIAGVYEKLLSMLWSLERISSPDAQSGAEFKREPLAAFYAALEGMNAAFNMNRILLPRSLVADVRRLTMSMTNIADQISLEPEDSYDQFYVLAETVKPKLEALVDDFRDLLGVDPHVAGSSHVGDSIQDQ